MSAIVICSLAGWELDLHIDSFVPSLGIGGNRGELGLRPHVVRNLAVQPPIASASWHRECLRAGHQFALTEMGKERKGKNIREGDLRIPPSNGLR